MDAKSDSGSATEINQCCSHESQDKEDDIQDQSGKKFLPFTTFCKMKDDESVGKSERNAESLGVDQQEQGCRKNENELCCGFVEDGGKPKSLAALFSVQQTESNVSCSGHLTVPGYDNMSFRSNSTTSTRSFAFPVLMSDWNESPIRMGDVDKRFSKKSRQWSMRMCFGCYNV